MKQKLYTPLLTILLLLNLSVFAAGKKDAINKEEQLINHADMYLAGEWAFYADKCLDGKKYKKFLKDLSKLSWPDYKSYMAGRNRYSTDEYLAPNCSQKDTKALQDWYDWIISELTYLTGSSSNLDDQITETKGKNKTSEIDSINDIEEKLKKLKQLYDDGLISLTDYEDKKDEILDSF